MNTQFKTISTQNLKVGMFIAELDRPTHQTPFPMQGFYVKSSDEICSLKHYCKTVSIDLIKSAVMDDCQFKYSIEPTATEHFIPTAKKPQVIRPKQTKSNESLGLKIVSWASLGAITIYTLHTQLPFFA